MKLKNVCLFVLVAASLIWGTTSAYAKIRSDQDKVKPLFFIENIGQVVDENLHPRADVQFRLVADGGINVFVGSGSIHYLFSPLEHLPGEINVEAKPITPLSRPDSKEIVLPFSYSSSCMDVELIGADKHAIVIPEQRMEYAEPVTVGGSGKNAEKAMAYTRITYKNIYPHIDWVLYTINGQLKHEFVVRKGGRVSDIKLKYNGTTNLKVNMEGNLIAETPLGAITEKAPVTFQKDGKHINSIYRLSGDMLGYETGNYSGDLIIDPLIQMTIN